MGASQDLPENIQRASEYFGLFYDTKVLDLIVVETKDTQNNSFRITLALRPLIIIKDGLLAIEPK